MNVILIMNDTLRYDYIGANGNTWMHTPVLDRFAEESAVFDRCYVGSFATIPCRHDLIKGRFGAPLNPWVPLEWEALTLPEVLRENGYVTMLINDTPHLINYGYGFDRPFHAWEMIRGNEVDRIRTDWFKEYRLSDASKFKHNSQMSLYHRQTKDITKEDEYFAPRVMSAACEWLERNAGHEKFFLWVDSFDPHEPWDPPQHYVDLYDPEYDGIEVFWPQYNLTENFLTEEEQAHIGKLYAGEVTMMDRWIGRVFDTLERLHLAHNTLVVVTSDHGHYFGEHGLQSKTGPLYEEISHQVLQVRHPDGIGRGKRIGGIVKPPDFAPTILDMLGIDAPAEMEIQGTSWLPLLTGEKRSIRSTAISGNFPVKVTGDMRRQPSMHLPSGWSTLTATNRDWALIDHPDPARRELYHLPSDIGQANNVIADNPEMADRLHREVTRFLRRNKAPRWMQRLYAEGLDEMEMPEHSDFIKYKNMRGMPHATPLDGNVF